jgi:hypothetical protein
VLIAALVPQPTDLAHQIGACCCSNSRRSAANSASVDDGRYGLVRRPIGFE